MLGKISGVARLLALLLAIVAAFVASVGGNENIGLALVALGLIGGLGFDDNNAVRLFVVILVLPAVGGALGNIPEIGDKLGAVALNVALAAAGVAATVIAVRLFKNSMADLSALGGK
jgi:hypothetical protein